MAIYVTITKCEKISLEMTLTDPNLNNFCFFNQLSNLNVLSHGSVKKEYPGFVFLRKQTFWCVTSQHFDGFYAAKTYKDIQDDSQS